jgi:hypothetical protein
MAVWGPCNSCKAKCINLPDVYQNCIQLTIKLHCTDQTSRIWHSIIQNQLCSHTSFVCQTTTSRKQTNAGCPGSQLFVYIYQSWQRVHTLWMSGFCFVHPLLFTPNLSYIISLCSLYLFPYTSILKLCNTNTTTMTYSDVSVV